jgi:hypothetical protein
MDSQTDQKILDIGTLAHERIEKYLLTGMHYSTKDAQLAISKLIALTLCEEQSKFTPSEFNSGAKQYLQKNKSEFSI